MGVVYTEGAFTERGCLQREVVYTIENAFIFLRHLIKHITFSLLLAPPRSLMTGSSPASAMSVSVCMALSSVFNGDLSDLGVLFGVACRLTFLGVLGVDGDGELNSSFSTLLTPVSYACRSPPLSMFSAPAWPHLFSGSARLNDLGELEHYHVLSCYHNYLSFHLRITLLVLLSNLRPFYCELMECVVY